VKTSSPYLPVVSPSTLTESEGVKVSLSALQRTPAFKLSPLPIVPNDGGCSITHSKTTAGASLTNKKHCHERHNTISSQNTYPSAMILSSNILRFTSVTSRSPKWVNYVYGTQLKESFPRRELGVLGEEVPLLLLALGTADWIRRRRIWRLRPFHRKPLK
jgi:hypothetical protein